MQAKVLLQPPKMKFLFGFEIENCVISRTELRRFGCDCASKCQEQLLKHGSFSTLNLALPRRNGLNFNLSVPNIALRYIEKGSFLKYVFHSIAVHINLAGVAL